MVQVIERAFGILEFIASHGKQPVRLTEIADKAGLSLPTTANIVKTLVHLDYLEQVGRKVGYRLGTAVFQRLNSPSLEQDLIDASRKPMTALREQINETSLLAVVRNNKRIILHLEESDQVLHARTRNIVDIYETSTGRLLIAYFATKQLDQLIKAIGLPSKNVWPEAVTRERLEKALQKIRTDGSVQIFSIFHTVGFAVPIFKNGEVVAGLSVFVPESRYTEEAKVSIFKSIKKAAAAIGSALESSKK